jgi:pyruvate/2-oxoglutarate dehydrogenase complex dihydrolipoamide dehydrogenase (E3) component
MADNQFDIIVIGGGPGGYVAAIRAAQLGFKTAVVEREHLGGICSNWGCIPTKALLRSAEIFHYFNHAKDYGLSAEKIGFDIKAIIQRSRGIAGQMNTGVQFLFKKNKIATSARPSRRRRARLVPVPTRPPTSSSRPARARAFCPASSPTRSRSGPISRR